MAVTPLLGEVAEIASKAFVSYTVNQGTQIPAEEYEIAEDAIVIAGFNEVGKQILYQLGTHTARNTTERLPQIVAFDTDPMLIDKTLLPMENTAVMYGDGENPEVISAHGVHSPRAIFIAYDHHEKVMAATSRLRTIYPNTPIYTRAETRKESIELEVAGATEVIVERDELPRSAPALLLRKRAREASSATQQTKNVELLQWRVNSNRTNA